MLPRSPSSPHRVCAPAQYWPKKWRKWTVLSGLSTPAAATPVALSPGPAMHSALKHHGRHAPVGAKALRQLHLLSARASGGPPPAPCHARR